MKKVLGYIRVSTTGQAEEGISLDNQAERIRTYCTYKGLELVDILEDAGISGGKNAARDGFVSLLDAIEKRQIEALVIYSLERLSRDMLTLLAFERLLDEYDIELHTIEGTVNTSTPDGFMNFAMKAFLGEMERRQIKYRTRSAMEHMKAQGSVIGSIPYGFTREGDKLIENPEEQAIIQRVNTMHQNGMSLSDIARALHDAGIQTRSGKQFDTTQVKRIITGYIQKWHRKNTSIGNTIKNFISQVA